MQKKNFIFLFLFLISTNTIFSQKDGYWDKTRATTEEITVSARDRIVIKTQDFPEGTTEVVYRITLLDKNQQMVGSLVSVLKAIPDPTGISQGSAGAVFILSKISGDDKCKYAVFSSDELAMQYKESGKTDDACLVQDTPVSKDAKRLSTEKSTCMRSNSGNLWFGFESKNWIMNQKIILEVVPWVDNKLSRGWTLANRKAIIEQCKTSNLAQKMTNSDDFCVCILDKIQTKYKFKEFQKLLAVERTKAFRDFGNSCFGESSLSKSVYDNLRKQAAMLAKQGMQGEAITKLTTIINDGKATALDYNAIGSSYVLTKQYGKAIKFLKEGEKIDDTELLIKLNLAHAYLLNDNFSSAKAIYKEYQSQNVTDSLSWTQKVKQDFAAFKKVGIKNDDFERVLKLMDK
ncbi:tetratricopeptide repeat protein [Flavobacterium bomense]|uniref:Tetratricopeptide repeat protein n=1 Tax=Flavobacterium bomense TaxID=2497483 RepID=A0A432CLJ1_9FLAO|nr:MULTISPECIES: tetratricopeptide repeat protein [Flavobacterium]RTY91931.1 tetratricopeptide repeat protein [Flavobacterium sp. RSP46]RTZ04123.1 tetratricopeptide repeat protein [Flavobacterium bomense]